MTQKNFIKTALRIPVELHAAIHQSAKKEVRSYNSEILFRLRSTFKADLTNVLKGEQ